jgi:hypothetical protein
MTPARATLRLLALAVVLAGGLPALSPRDARAEAVDDLLAQLKSVKEEKALKPIEDGLRLAVKPDHVNKLLAALSPPNPLTAPILLELLGARADGPTTIPPLQRIAKVGPPWFSARVFVALSRLGDATALPKLTQRVEDTNLKPQERDEYLSALASVAVRGSDDERQGTLQILGRLRIQEGLGALVDGLTDSVAENRRTAQAGLRGTMESLYPYARFDFAGVGYDATGGTDESRRKPVETIRKALMAMGIPAATLKSIKPPPQTPKTISSPGGAGP